MLSDNQILKAIKRNEIFIEPFNRKCLGSNSYDVHLGDTLLTYQDAILDAKKNNPTIAHKIGSEGFVLQPNTLYLGSTIEYTNCTKHVPIIEGKSSVGRLGIAVHITAGVGDAGFCGNWTLELFCIKPVRIYAGMPIAQVIFFKCGKVLKPYNLKENAKYSNQGKKPVSSKFFENFSK